MPERKKIAAIITEYRPHSHADVIVTKFLKGFPTDQGMLEPRVDVVSMYVDQFADTDLSRPISEAHGVPIYGSINKALTLGGKELAVDGVLLIGEHGDYPWNEKEQQLYPRKYFMEQICAVLATNGRGVPIFNDKHLSYNWADALWMYQRARQVGAPFMAGSTIPLGWRSPWLELPRNTPLTEAVAIGFSGLDIYGFHTLEGLQCMAERRREEEVGVAAVTCLEGEAVWRAAEAGEWSRELAEAACACIRNKPEGPMEKHCANPAVFLVEYRDGFKGAVLMLNGYVEDLAFAGRTTDGVCATEYYLQNGPPHAHFSYLSLNIEEMFLTGVPSFPVERTLLTTGILEAALDSRHQGHVRLETPHLDVQYRSYESIPWRPTQPRPTTPETGLWTAAGS